MFGGTITWPKSVPAWNQTKEVTSCQIPIASLRDPAQKQTEWWVDSRFIVLYSCIPSAGKWTQMPHLPNQSLRFTQHRCIQHRINLLRWLGFAVDAPQKVLNIFPMDFYIFHMVQCLWCIVRNKHCKIKSHLQWYQWWIRGTEVERIKINWR